METIRKNLCNKETWLRWGFPLIHLIVSLVAGSFIYQKDPYPTNGLYRELEVFEDTKWWGDGAEKFVWWLLSILIGGVLICIAWNVGAMLIRKKRKLPFILIVVALLVCIVIFPTNYAYETDNFLSYSYAVRAMPDYWQNILLGCYYRGCLLLFPHPVTIPFVQLASLLGALYYISERVSKRYGRKVAWIPYILILFPEFMDIGTNPYRNCIYTVMCIWYYGILFMDVLENKRRTTNQVTLMCAAAVFLSYFRSEGILTIVTFVLVFILIFNVPATRWTRFIVCGTVLSYILLMSQKLGEFKYYGESYSIINQMDVLQDILSNDAVNLEYAGVQEDLMAIDRVVPLHRVINYGMSGYRVSNYEKNGTLNQLMISAEESQAFMDGVKRIIICNLPLYLESRMSMFYEACTGTELIQQTSILEAEDEKEIYVETVTEVLDKQNQDYAFSYLEIFEDGYPGGLFINQEKLDLAYKITGAQTKYYETLMAGGIIIVARIMVFLLFPVLVISYVKNSKNNGINENREQYFWLGTLGVIILQLLAVFFMSPEGREAYYYPSYFVMLLGSFIFLLERNKNSRTEKSIQMPETVKENAIP